MKKLLCLFTFYFCSLNVFAQQGPVEILSGNLEGVSKKLSEIKSPAMPSPRPKKSRDFGENEIANKRVRFTIGNPNAISTDGALQSAGAASDVSPKAPLITFDGCVSADNTAVFGSTFIPPDPVLSVGPNHIVQMVNSVHRVFNKSGTSLTNAIKFSDIVAGSSDDGDPITLYDHVADRWLLLQFDLSASFGSGASNSLRFAISQTNDPTGAYFTYIFNTTTSFPDYPHVGIWNNMYVITTHEFNVAATAYIGQGFYAVERNKMLDGVPQVTGVRFVTGASEGGYLPVSMEGFKTPETSSLPTFATFDADEFGGSSTDAILLRTMNVDFSNPASSTLSGVIRLNTASFDANAPSSRSAIEQASTTSGLDAINDRMMSRIIYRRFDNYESLVMNHGVNVSGGAGTAINTFTSAMRWYELRRNTPSDPWVIHQQSTYAPSSTNGATGDNRWMGSPGIDQRGNIAIAYSKSSSTTFPSLAYTERRVSDPLNTMSSTEQTFHAGTGSQTSGNRWGDYSAMTTDPTDEETMWYTGEYYGVTGTFNFRTRIGSIKVNDPITTPSVRFKFGGTIARQKDAIPNPFIDYSVRVMIENAPSQPVTVTLNSTGTATPGVDYDLINAAPFDLSASNMTKDFTIRVYNDGLGEPTEFLTLSYTLNANGGNAIAGTFNQTHRVTFVPISVCPSSSAVTNNRPLTFCEGDSTILSTVNTAGYTYQWKRNGVAISGATQFQYVVKTTGSYVVDITNSGCTLSSLPTNVTVNLGTPTPTTTSRSIVFGTVITPGNGLQASAICPAQNSQTYSGPTIGYDNGLKSGADPTVTFAGIGTSTGKVKVAIRWKKKSGGDQTACASADAGGNPFNNEVSFQLRSPNNTTIVLLPTGAYASGGTSVGVVTTTFEDGAAAVGTVPATGTFRPSQSLSLFNGADPNGVWTLLPNDNGGTDPLCVESFTLTVYTPNSGGAATISWFANSTGGAALSTGTEFIPTDTAPGTYTYYAQASCSGTDLTGCNPSLRKAATLTIVDNCPVPSVGGTVSGSTTVCAGSNSGTLSLSGHTGSIIRWESSIDNFVSSTPIANTTSTLNFTNLSQTTKYRAVVQNGSCPTANSSEATITVNSVNAGASNTGPYTEGQTISVSASGGTGYSWAGPAGFTSTSNPATRANATLAMGGVYSVTVTQGICTATATTNVVVNPSGSCSVLVAYDYIKAGNTYDYLFPLMNNQIIAQVPFETTVKVTPVCPVVPILSFRMRLQGPPPYDNHEVVESISPYALFNNLGDWLYGRNLIQGDYVLTVTGYNQVNGGGSVVYGPVATNFSIVANTASIAAPTYTQMSVCAGSTFYVSFAATGSFGVGNMFEVHLSDRYGSFDDPIVIGTSAVAGNVTCTIPSNIMEGTGYKIRVVSTNQIVVGGIGGPAIAMSMLNLTLVSPTNDFTGGNTTKKATQSIMATNKILSPAKVTYQAGNAVILQAGFQSNANTVFKAEIRGCN